MKKEKKEYPMSEENEKKQLLFYPPSSLALPQKEHYEYLDSLITTNPWKAFVRIHATLQYQMQWALYFHNKEKIRKDEFRMRWRLILDYFGFRQLIEICFIVGIIDGNLRDKLVKFNEDRNDIVGHIKPDLKKDVSDTQVAKICERGLDSLKELHEAMHAVLFSRSSRRVSSHE